MEDYIIDMRKAEHTNTASGWKNVQAVLDVIATAPIPFAGLPAVATQYIQTALQESYNSKIRLIQQEIIAGHKFITTDQLSEIQVFEDFNRLLQTTIKTNVNEKIQFATRLFVRGCLTGRSLATDIYEEYLHIIDDISLRELSALEILRRVELAPDPFIDKSMSEKEYLPQRYWKAFKEKLVADLAIMPDHVYPIMKRLERTGLFAMYNGFSFGIVENGTTTDYFRDFYNYIIAFDSKS